MASPTPVQPPSTEALHLQLLFADPLRGAATFRATQEQYEADRRYFMQSLCLSAAEASAIAADYRTMNLVAAVAAAEARVPSGAAALATRAA